MRVLGLDQFACHYLPASQNEFESLAHCPPANPLVTSTALRQLVLWPSSV